MLKWLDDLIAEVTENTGRLRIAVYLFLFVPGLVLSPIGALLNDDWGGLLLNLGTEFIGAGVTYFLLDRILGRWEEREAKKADLISQLGSRVKDVAIAAAEELRRHGWFSDGSLRRAGLSGANLYRAYLLEEIFAHLKPKKLASSAVPEHLSILRSFQFVTEYKNVIMRVWQETTC